MLGDVDAEAAGAVAGELRAAGAVADAVAVDVADERSVEAAAAACGERLGRPADVLVANAGIGYFAPLLETEPTAWRRVLDVNLTGTFLTLRAFARRMVEHGDGGNIVVSSSVYGLRGGRDNSAYSASKFGVVGLVECAAAELARHGIVVNAVCPGQVDTEMMAHLIEERATMREQPAEEVRGELLRRIPLGRMASVEELGDVYLFLASPLARYTTGQSIAVDGGMGLG
jgi:NAD(P)-dependent dehydrogenase (short-subunit alcohol dehydrogenase family)